MNNNTTWGSGWSFPPTFDRANNELQMVHNENNINQSIDIILSTLRGERSVYPEFGSDLRAFLFRNMDETTQGEIIDSVKRSLLEHEPRIEVDDVSIAVDGDAEPVVRVSVSYQVRNTNSRHNHVFPFSTREGSNLHNHFTG